MDVGGGMRPVAVVALTLGLAGGVARAEEPTHDEAPLEPARPGLDRFRDHHHELGIVTGSGGPLSGAGSYAVSGLRYHENNGELMDAFFTAIFKILDDKWDKRVDCSVHACNFFEITAYVPHLLGERSQPGVKGAIYEFGLTVPTDHVVFQIAASVGFVSARTQGEFQGNARDALALTANLPLARWLTFSLRTDLNLFALYPKKVLSGWRRDSPITVGFHADLGKRVYADASFIRADIVDGGQGTELGLGLRF